MREFVDVIFLVTFWTDYFNAYWHRLTVVQAEPFKKAISKAISHLTKEVQNAKALIDGVLVNYRSLAFILVGEVQKIHSCSSP